MKGVKPWHDPDAAKELFLGKTHPEHGHGIGLRLNFASERLFKPKGNDSVYRSNKNQVRSGVVFS